MPPPSSRQWLDGQEDFFSNHW